MFVLLKVKMQKENSKLKDKKGKKNVKLSKRGKGSEDAMIDAIFE